MVQYNKNLINKETLHLIKKNKNNKISQKGGDLQNMFYESNILVKLIVLVILFNIIFKCIELMYKFKLNGVVYPIVFGTIFYQLYITLTFHMKKLGLSLTSVNNRNQSKIGKTLDDIIDIIYTFPKLIPQIPRISNPTFNNQPFKGIREGIRTLQIPYKFKGDNYKLKINFPKLEIPFFDPLAGICCVWSKFEKLLKLFQKAFEVPKKAIKKIADVFIKIFEGIKKGVCLAIKNIKYLIITICSPIIGIVYGIIGFFTVINKLAGGKLDGAINKLKNFVSGIINFEPKGVKCGGGYNNNTKYEKNEINDYIINYNGPCIDHIYHKIDILNYENSYKNKVCKKKINKMSIFKIHRKELNEKNGFINYVNKYTDRKFKKFQKTKLEEKIKKGFEFKQNTNIYKPNFVYYNNAIHDYMPAHEVDQLKKDLDQIKYNNLHNNNLHNIQKGGGLGDALRKLSKLKDIFNNIDKYANIVCVVVNKISNLIKKIGQKINAVANKILFGVPKGIKKFGQLINFIGKIIEWFIRTIIDKGVRIIEAAVELVFNLSLGNLPPAISTKIFKPIKAIFTILLTALKLPFISFFTEIIAILTDIPRLFNTFADSLNTVCSTIRTILKKIVNALMAPVKAAIEVFNRIKNAFKSFGGSIGYLDKHKYELQMMINRRSELLMNSNINKNYLMKLDQLIKDKEEKIKKIEKLLVKYDKIKKDKHHKIPKELTYK